MIKTERGEALEISRRLLEQFGTFPISESRGQAGADLRWAIGRYLSNFSTLIDESQLGTALFDCFESAFAAGATLSTMDGVRTAMFAEAPKFSLGNNIVNTAVLFSFVEQAKIIGRTTFRSRGEVDLVIDRMVLVIEEIKLSKSDTIVVSDYRNFIALSALLIQHLASTQRMLPRIVQFKFPVHYPSLAMANRVYGNGARAEELAAENKTVHPAFMQRHVQALSE